MNKTIIFEGLDRCLKDTLIEKTKEFVPPAHVLHYAKPPKNHTDLSQEDYQKLTFQQLFRTFADHNQYANKSTLICNRAHLGEAVYAPIYRNYSGDYVFEIEKAFRQTVKDIYLIVLVDTNLDAYLKRDDGDSFNGADADKVKVEIDAFANNYLKSRIENKTFIDLAQYYIDKKTIDTEKVLERIKQLLNE